MPGYPDLVTLSQTTTALAQSLPPDQTALPTVISAASKAIQRYLRRIIPLTDYTEIHEPIPGQWDKYAGDMVQLLYYPIVKSSTYLTPVLRSGRTPAIQIQNIDTTNNQNAFFQLYTLGDALITLPINVGVRLTRFASGSEIQASFPFFGTPASTGFSVAASGSGSSLTTGTYLCSYSNVNDAGESVRSADVAVSVTAGQNLVFTLPTLIPQATSNNVYVSTANGDSSTETRQNPTVITANIYTVSALTAGTAPNATPTGTVAQLAAAINALGNGWMATVQNPTQFSSWGTADLWGSESTMGAFSSGQMQGLDVFQTYLNGATVIWEAGMVFLPQSSTSYGQGPGNVYQWPGSSDIALGGSAWRQPVLCRYSAGFATTPEDIQQACFITIKAMIQELQLETYYEQERIDLWQAKLAGVDERSIPASAKRLLAPYRTPRY